MSYDLKTSVLIFDIYMDNNNIPFIEEITKDKKILKDFIERNLNEPDDSVCVIAQILFEWGYLDG